MSVLAKTESHSYGWLDSFAVGMSLLCAVHCLITPLLLLIMPMIATTFWVHQDFHLWLLLLVVPTTGLALLLGCKKHKDKWVFGAGLLGLLILICVAIYGACIDTSIVCQHCAESSLRGFTEPITVTNSLGGLFLIGAHVRNYALCRRQSCQHD